jgi:hypothetical protein
MNRRFSLAAAFVLFIFFSFLPSSFAIYQWVDENGIFHITDYPKPGKQPVEQEQGNAATPGGPAASSRDVQEGKQPASLTGKEQPKQDRPLSSPASRSPADMQAKQPAGSATAMTAEQPRQEPTTASAGMGMEVPRSSEPVASASNTIPDANNVAALVAGFLTIFLFVAAGLYLYGSLCLYLIATKLNVPAAWTAWIPLLQIWAFLGSAGKPLWWVLLFFIPFVNALVGVYLWMCIAENLGMSKVFGLLMLIPVVNLVFLGVLAFSSKGGKTGVAPAF